MRLSQPQIAALKLLSEYGAVARKGAYSESYFVPDGGFYLIGNKVTINALLKRGLVEKIDGVVRITEAGRAAVRG